MEWLWAVALLLVIIGVAGIVLPMLPGLPLLFAGLLLGAWLDGFSRVSGMALMMVGLLALLGFLVDFLASMLSVKSVGASRQAVVGTLIGGVVGILGGVPGLIFGTVIGAIIGEVMAQRHLPQAAKAGIAAGIGFIVAVALKLLLALAMIAIFAWSYFY